MALSIIRRTGTDDFEVVGYWTATNGMEAQTDDPPRFMEDPAFDRYDEEQVMQELDGPDYFAVPEGEA